MFSSLHRHNNYVFVFSFIITLLFGGLLNKTANAEETKNGRDVQLAVKNRYLGDDLIGYTEMKLISKSGHVRIRKFIRYVKDYNKVKKILIRVYAPADIKRTGFLVWEDPDGPDTQFLYLPAMKKIRRIASQNQDQRFLGSDFTFYDMGEVSIDDYTYSDTKTVILDGKECWYYEAFAKPGGHAIYGKMEIWTEKKTLVRIKIMFYDKSDRPLKLFFSKEIRLVQDIWTPHYLHMENLQDGHTTEYRMRNITYNVGHSDQLFSLINLETGGDIINE
jgi:hypothetical protein